uniref:Glycosyl transferase 64 domain-containing protein n=1 Tax=Polytomella parva TaxID=51329 RepID=A0A7S0YWS1_9CHLO|mmetsp:Transcript_8029/g.15591  ORF Transcript_8029/g.15591 Transcript_8029/m.15591 type:complete len:381 (+) Transcript_8029:59-1201(+)
MNIAPSDNGTGLRERFNSLFWQKKYSKEKKTDDDYNLVKRSITWIEFSKRNIVPLSMLVAVLSFITLYLCLIPKKSLPYIDPLKCPPTKEATLITASRPIQYETSEADHLDRFTIVLATYKRPDLLKKAIKRYSTCKEIDAIRVIWSESNTPPIRSVTPDYFSQNKDVRYDVKAKNSLNSRFEPLDGLRTEAVFSMDDDMDLPCDDLKHAFEVWKEDKWNLAGFYPRLHIHQPDCGYRYLTSYETFITYGQYSIVLTKAAMLHRDYFRHYTEVMPRQIREMITSWMNCEDIAMQIMVSNLTRSPPNFVHSHTAIDWGKGLLKVKGISSSNAHFSRRNMCLTEFSRFYGNSLPLFPTPFESLDDRFTPITETLYGFFNGRI